MRSQDLGVGHRTIDDQPLESSHEPRTRFAHGTLELDPRDIQEAREEPGLRVEHVVQIAHDLKSPLHTMALETSILQHRIAAHEPIDAGPVLDRIMHNIEYLDRMVQDLLDGCSPEQTRKTLALAPTDLRTLLETVVERSVATRDRARVFLKADRSAIVMVDDLRIQRVVANLLSNALKYSPIAGGVVVRLDLYEDYCGVSVIDAGPGVTTAEASYIFDKYRRTRSARGREGSGLGLYVSRQIIEAHGGRLDVECVRGAGSRFFFELPLG
ncbi:MAG: HAMP domain-containing histidine kinase [Deltaproteobacteria bacterium]|nr:HAMP domain-containing histidine kinase [Deltaproteobacteria bacterium]